MIPASEAQPPAVKHGERWIIFQSGNITYGALRYEIDFYFQIHQDTSTIAVKEKFSLHTWGNDSSHTSPIMSAFIPVKYIIPQVRPISAPISTYILSRFDEGPFFLYPNRCVTSMRCLREFSEYEVLPSQFTKGELTYSDPMILYDSYIPINSNSFLLLQDGSSRIRYNITLPAPFTAISLFDSSYTGQVNASSPSTLPMRPNIVIDNLPRVPFIQTPQTVTTTSTTTVTTTSTTIRTTTSTTTQTSTTTSTTTTTSSTTLTSIITTTSSTTLTSTITSTMTSLSTTTATTTSIQPTTITTTSTTTQPPVTLTKVNTSTITEQVTTVETWGYAGLGVGIAMAAAILTLIRRK